MCTFIIFTLEMKLSHSQNNHWVVNFVFTGLGNVDKAMKPISTDLFNFIEISTRDQTKSELWLHLHEYRITSSMFGNVYRSRDKCSSLIKQICGNRYSVAYCTIGLSRFVKKQQTLKTGSITFFKDRGITGSSM